MLTYNDLRPEEDYNKRDYELVFPQLQQQTAVKQRIISKLLALKNGLDSAIALRRAEENLIVASWNIKEFGHTTQRLPESYFYLAEVLSRFDLIAVQEIKSGLQDLYIILRLLGDGWGYLVNDITEGIAGNSERSCYIFNKSRVQMAGLAGEIVLWDDLTRNTTIKQLKRTPYITGFTADWKTFALLNVHLHPGESPADIATRREEVSLLLQALAVQCAKKHLWSENIILVGDFNFYSGAGKDDATIELIHNAGYRQVQSLIGVDTNLSQTNAYDRMFLSGGEYFTLGQNAQGRENGGVFNPFDYVFREDEATTYQAYLIAQYGGTSDIHDPTVQNNYFNDYWRKNQLSDHLPIWFELIIDSSPVFLERSLQTLSNQLPAPG